MPNKGRLQQNQKFECFGNILTYWSWKKQIKAGIEETIVLSYYFYSTYFIVYKSEKTFMTISLHLVIFLINCILITDLQKMYDNCR